MPVHDPKQKFIPLTWRRRSRPTNRTKHSRGTLEWGAGAASGYRAAVDEKTARARSGPGLMILSNHDEEIQD
jgi:hypothetical protein